MTEDQALEKNNRINLLFDFYESLLTEKQQNFTRYYFQDNYTLGEISSLFHITRQAVYEHIKRAELVLEDYESKLHLLEKHQQRGQMIQEMEKMSILNEKLLVAQMSLLTDDDCNTQMAVEYCKNKLKDAKKYQINAEKVSFFFHN